MFFYEYQFWYFHLFQKLKLKILSLQKLIEQLRAEIKEKTHKITELEEKLKSQVKASLNTW